jgi:hypothetical protein
MNAIRPKRTQDDEFFANGDLLSHKNSDVIISYIAPEPCTAIESTKKSSQYNVGDGREPPIDEESSDTEEEVYRCCAPHCNEIFRSIFECEHHYNAQHTFECKECKRVFPNEFLLDRHLQETHDTYFQTMLEYGKGSYPCLVMDCNEQFSTAVERFDHLRTVHDYPKWFRFSSKATKKKFYKKKSKTKNLSRTVASDNDGRQKFNREQVISLSVQNDQRESRRQRRKEKNKEIPCRFYHSKSGCRRGNRCMFLHDDDNTSQNSNGERKKIRHTSEMEIEDNCNDARSTSSDVEMNELCTLVDRKAQICLPAKISFGRRRR